MKKKKLLLLISCALCFIIGNSIAFYKEIDYFPCITVFVIAAWLFFFHLDWLILLLSFITPLSISLSEYTKTSFDLSLPSELIMISLTILFLSGMVIKKIGDKKLLFHPVTIVLILYLIWLFITSITSEYPIVSFKYLATKIWFLVSCFFVLIPYFKDNKENIFKFFIAYATALSIVVIITTVRHAGYQFSEYSGHWIMTPFYNDHTAYGAALAFFLPIVMLFIFRKQAKLHRAGLIIMALILLLGLFLSSSRAAWISIIAALGVFVILKLKIKLSWILGTVLLLFFVFYNFSDEILYKMSRNQQDVSENLADKLQSITNISTDASNVERLNRWNSAISMIKERPVFGWGPGTYQFCYAPFQLSKYKTIITTNFGDGGNAHSEYLGSASEMGIVGAVIVLMWIILFFYYGVNFYKKSEDKESKLIALALILSITTYTGHGLVNNFLDTDKLALPYWATFAAIVVLSKYDFAKQS